MIPPSRRMPALPTPRMARCFMWQRATPARFVLTAQAIGRRQAKSPLDGAIAGQDFAGSFAATLIVSADGKTLYALDQGNWRIVLLDAATHAAHRLHRHRHLSFRPRAVARRGTPLRHQHRPVRILNHSRRQREKSAGHRPALSALWLPVQGRARRRRRRRQKDSRPWRRELRPRQFALDLRCARLASILSSPRSFAWAQKSPKTAARPSAVRRPPASLPTSDAVYVSLAHEDAVAKISADGAQLLAQAALSPFTGARFQGCAGPPACAA